MLQWFSVSMRIWSTHISVYYQMSLSHIRRDAIWLHFTCKFPLKHTLLLHFAYYKKVDRQHALRLVRPGQMPPQHQIFLFFVLSSQTYQTVRLPISGHYCFWRSVPTGYTDQPLWILWLSLFYKTNRHIWQIPHLGTVPFLQASSMACNSLSQSLFL